MGENERNSPEIIRGAYPELSRCEACGALDRHTHAVERAGASYWLHDSCGRGWVPTLSWPVNRGTRLAGFVVELPDGTFQAWRLGGSVLTDAGNFRAANVAEAAATAPRSVLRQGGWFSSRWRAGKGLLQTASSQSEA